MKGYSNGEISYRKPPRMGRLLTAQLHSRPCRPAFREPADSRRARVHPWKSQLFSSEDAISSREAVNRVVPNLTL